MSYSALKCAMGDSSVTEEGQLRFSLQACHLLSLLLVSLGQITNPFVPQLYVRFISMRKGGGGP